MSKGNKGLVIFLFIQSNFIHIENEDFKEIQTKVFPIGLM